MRIRTIITAILDVQFYYTKYVNTLRVKYTQIVRF